jgi:NAD(P)-dependent dehydrogenase (short-subunit alcohol dehydrogenase family)
LAGARTGNLEILRRVCVITGASGVLGTAFIRRFRAQYSIVAIHNRHALPFPTQDQIFVDPLDPKKPLAANENPISAIRADLSDAQSIEKLCLEVRREFRRVDLLINAAAAGAWRSFLSAAALADAEYAFRVNVLAPLRLATGFARHFWCSQIEENIGCRRNIVNISSTAGIYVYPDLGQGVYGACKAALNHATYHLASEFWDIGIRVNAVAPNSFPGRVPIDVVLDQIITFDAGEHTGQLAVLDE